MSGYQFSIHQIKLCLYSLCVDTIITPNHLKIDHRGVQAGSEMMSLNSVRLWTPLSLSLSL